MTLWKVDITLPCRTVDFADSINMQQPFNFQWLPCRTGPMREGQACSESIMGFPLQGEKHQQYA